jgi:hypothetical protein
MCPGDPSLPQSIPDGHTGMVPLLDMDTMNPVGQIEFTFIDTAPLGQFFWQPGGTGNPLICFINDTEPDRELRLSFDFDNIEWFGDPLPIIGAQLGVRQANSATMEEIGTQSTIPIELQALHLQSIAPVMPGPESVPQDFFAPSTFSDFYDVAVNPGGTVFVEWFYLIDP